MIQENKKILYENPTLLTQKNQDNKVKCKCGHSVEFWHGETKRICGWCPRMVYKNKKEEFKEILIKKGIGNGKKTNI